MMVKTFGRGTTSGIMILDSTSVSLASWNIRPVGDDDVHVTNWNQVTKDCEIMFRLESLQHWTVIEWRVEMGLSTVCSRAPSGSELRMGKLRLDG